ncbi:c-type cytochrome [Sanyastnella coralliicola]|uniref:c-type cytochrome n=1 Tax=Sanyastnella coralliicola TaxID=3069118 RepID=UPI0027B9E029|nr:cytochrome c [Longitalea sp. SCSIO 12813]
MLTRNTFLFALVALLMGACTTDPNSPGLEYMPDMYRSPAVEAYVDYGMDPYHFGEAQYDSLNHRLSARKPAAGSIAYAGDVQPYNMPYPYPNTTEGYEEAAALKSPLPTTKANIERGKEVYEIMCIHCHGEAGKGDGAISKNGHIKGIPDYSGKLKDLPEGKAFHSIHYGKGLMGSHASQISQYERWQVVQYVQVLQNGGDMPPFDENGNVMAAGAASAEEATEEVASEETEG